MPDLVIRPEDTERVIVEKLVQLIRLCAERGIRIHDLMREALDICDIEAG
jgi:hypothetical protein